MRMLDSVVFTSSKTPDGDYWLSGTVYFYEGGIRYYTPLTVKASGNPSELDMVDALRLLTAELPNRLAKALAAGEKTKSSAVRPF